MLAYTHITCTDKQSGKIPITDISAIKTTDADAYTDIYIYKPYSLNILRESFHVFQEILNNLKYFNLENFAILYCGFVICETFITKMLKAMNPQNI